MLRVDPIPAPRRAVASRGLAGTLLLGIVCVALLLGCDPRRNLFLSGLPGVEAAMRVAEVHRRGEFLDATLFGSGVTLRTFVPATEACGRTLAPEAEVAFVRTGAAGKVRNAVQGTECGAVGIGTLSLWRRGRPAGGPPVPRELASSRGVYRDDDVAFLRGRFPLAGLVGWTTLADTLAVVPRTPACDAVRAREAATLEYRPAGTPVLALVEAGGSCPILGFIRPPPR